MLNMMGKWSDPRSWSGYQSALSAHFFPTSVTSGELSVPVAGFTLVGLPSLSRVNPSSMIKSSMAPPRWSSGWDGSQREEWAFRSPAIMEYSSVGRMSVLRSVVLPPNELLGGQYTFARVAQRFLANLILHLMTSVPSFWSPGSRSKEISCRMSVRRPPPIPPTLSWRRVEYPGKWGVLSFCLSLVSWMRQMSISCN